MKIFVQSSKNWRRIAKGNKSIFANGLVMRSHKVGLRKKKFYVISMTEPVESLRGKLRMKSSPEQ